MATLLLGLILTVCFGLKVTNGQATPMALYTVLRSDIGDGADGLQCTTDSTTCCTNRNGETRAGEFYFADGSPVLTAQNTTSDSYYRTRSSGLISLHRRSSAMVTGQFRCEIPAASGTLVNLFINIVNELPITKPGTVSISISITASGSNTAGETYILECSATVTVTESTDQPTITWLGPLNNPVPSEMVTATGSMSTLTFNPLAASHAGTYTCRAMVESEVQMKEINIIVQIPGTSSTISIFSDPAGTVFAGSNVALTCTVKLSSAVDVQVTVHIQLTDPAENQLTQNTSATTVVSGSTYTSRANTTLVSSDQSGVFMCRATISSASKFLTMGTLQAETALISVVLPPPVNVQATQASASAPVEVSWSPPSEGAATITGYRIFFENGVNVSVPAFFRSLGSNLDYHEQKISIRSESSHLISELINVTVVTVSATTSNAGDCNNDAAIALGVVVLSLVVLIAVAVVVVLVFVILRRQQAVTNPTVPETKELQDVSISTNVAYGQVKVESTSGLSGLDLYEDIGVGGASEREEDDDHTHYQ